MPRKKSARPQETSSIGWRLKQLRLRHGLTQLELAERAGVDPSFLSRIENSAQQRTKPKPDTVERLLDGLHATEAERLAIFHHEAPSIPGDEVARTIQEIAATEEGSMLPASVVDDRWCRWYMNRSLRAVLGYTQQEYQRCLGTHVLLEVLDPSAPAYSRIPDEDRAAIFAMRATSFKLHHEGQQFDNWYSELDSRIRASPWAAAIWDASPADLPIFMDRLDVVVINPIVGPLRFRAQLNRPVRAPRFTIGHWTPLDENTAYHLAELRARPKYGYELPLVDDERWTLTASGE